MLAIRPVASTALASSGSVGLKLTVSASEAHDIARINFTDKYHLSLRVSEAKDVASMSMAKGVSFRIASSESRDVAAFRIDNKAEFTLTATEAADTAVMALLGGEAFNIWATEAADVASMRLGITSHIRFAVTEAADTIRLAMERPSSFILGVTEDFDRASINLKRNPAMVLDATEAKDRFSAVLNNQNVRIAATEAADRASFRLNLIIGVRCAAKETPDGAEIYIAPRWWEIEGTRCCIRWTEATRPDSQYVDLGELVISATEKPDVFSGGGFDVSTGYILLDRQAHTTPFVLGVTPDDYILLEDGGGYLRGDG